MWIVALTELGTSLDVEAPALAADLGLVAYEARIRIGGGLPAVVCTTPDEAHARALLGKLRARRHGAVACDDALVVAADDMVPMRRFAFDHGSIVAGNEQLPFDDVFAVLRATYRTQTEARSEVVEKQTSMGRAIMTGGLMMSKKVTRDETKRTSDREQILYLFRRSGRPWILREKSAYYQGLGARMGVSQHENFNTTLALLREYMPRATFDDRLTQIRRVPERTRSLSGKVDVSSNADGMDLLAHVLAQWIYERTQAQPYRA
jgi:hypothetical protein